MTLDDEIISEVRSRLSEVVLLAGEAINHVYESGDFDATKKVDESPVTRADKMSDRIIYQKLKSYWPAYPILSEEAEIPDFKVRCQWDCFWVVDPLDGTKEFLNHTGEFTVNIALMRKHTPVLGMVYVPATGECYFGGREAGAWKALLGKSIPQKWLPIKTSKIGEKKNLKVVASRRHSSKKMDALLHNLKEYGIKFEWVNMGSSLKFCLLAEGKADWYPRLAPTCEWDTAAAQAVLEGAGGIVITESMEPLQYNSKDSLLNPSFHAFGDAALSKDSSLGKIFTLTSV